MTWNQSVIEHAAQALNASIWQLKIESANYPQVFANNDRPIQDAARELIGLIKSDQEAEISFFQNHTELNP